VTFDDNEDEFDFTDDGTPVDDDDDDNNLCSSSDRRS
jgi:hypothetical protein